MLEKVLVSKALWNSYNPTHIHKYTHTFTVHVSKAQKCNTRPIHVYTNTHTHTYQELVIFLEYCCIFLLSIRKT